MYVLIHPSTDSSSINFNTRLWMPLIFLDTFCYSVNGTRTITETCLEILLKIEVISTCAGARRHLEHTSQRHGRRRRSNYIFTRFSFLISTPINYVTISVFIVAITMCIFDGYLKKTRRSINAVRSRKFKIYRTGFDRSWVTPAPATKRLRPRPHPHTHPHPHPRSGECVNSSGNNIIQG